jgi:integrase
VLKFAQARGARTPHSAGYLSPYLGSLMEIKCLCRMRSIEVLYLTDAHASEIGIYVARCKRSHHNIVRWSPRLRSAWDAAVGVRATIRGRRSNRARPLPPPERRFLFVSGTMTRLSTSALGNAWSSLMRAALAAGVIAPTDRFTLHGLKHRGVTDTKGSRRRKQLASGHQTEAMVMRYDHDVPVVSPASPESLIERRMFNPGHE